jgi:hypothetical protein
MARRTSHIRCSTEHIIDGLTEFRHFGSDLLFKRENDGIALVFLVYITPLFQDLGFVLVCTLQNDNNPWANEPVLV